MILLSLDRLFAAATKHLPFNMSSIADQSSAVLLTASQPGYTLPNSGLRFSCYLSCGGVS